YITFDQYTDMLRRNTFWLLDSLKTGPVKKHLEAIKKTNLNPFSQYSKSKQESLLKDLLKHAIATVRYYKRIKSDDLGLENFPVVDKNIIKNNFNAFES